MIKRHNIFVVGLSVLIGASFWIVPMLTDGHTAFRYTIFETANGWGYDILVNDSLQIHQDYIPVLAAKKGFAEKQQAKKAAQLVIGKLKAGKNPSISRDELETIVGANE